MKNKMTALSLALAFLAFASCKNEAQNTGKVDGKEVVQLYSSKSDSKISRAAQELKGFQKVLVSAGSSQTLTINLPVKELAYYDVATKKWTDELGIFTLSIGNSSRDIKSKIEFTIK